MGLTASTCLSCQYSFCGTVTLSCDSIVLCHFILCYFIWNSSVYYFFVAIYQCRSGSPIEKHLYLALNFHVRMMIDSLALSKRTNCQRIVEPNATVELMSLATLSASQHTYKLQLAEDTLHPKPSLISVPRSGSLERLDIVVSLSGYMIAIMSLLSFFRASSSLLQKDRIAWLACNVV